MSLKLRTLTILWLKFVTYWCMPAYLPVLYTEVNPNLIYSVSCFPHCSTTVVKISHLFKTVTYSLLLYFLEKLSKWSFYSIDQIPGPLPHLQLFITENSKLVWGVQFCVTVSSSDVTEYCVQSLCLKSWLIASCQPFTATILLFVSMNFNAPVLTINRTVYLFLCVWSISHLCFQDLSML